MFAPRLIWVKRIYSMDHFGPIELDSTGTITKLLFEAREASPRCARTR